MKPSRTIAVAAICGWMSVSPALCANAPAWREAFDRKWEEHGREMAGKPWMRNRLVVLVADEGVPEDVVDKTEASLRAMLLELGARSLKVLRLEGRQRYLRGCSRDGIIRTACFSEAVEKIRASSNRAAGAVVYMITNDPIDLLPYKKNEKTTIGPPAGRASLTEGWAVTSEFWRIRNKGKSPDAFFDHGRDHTVRHELGHILGLAHHAAVPNPGFKEPPTCQECPHNGGRPQAFVHPECLMDCGSGDDDWRHSRKYGKGFGLCDKCRAAAAAVFRGLEEGLREPR